MKQIETLYKTYTGSLPESVTELPSSGSTRRYFRRTGKDGSLKAPKAAVLTK
jgi:hypothetical protein